MSSRQETSELAAVAETIRSHDRFLIVTHENPDGDALGSLLAMKLALDALGKDSEMYLYGDAPLPREYGFMPLEGLRREPPADASERVLVALDCANEQRLGPEPAVLERAPLTINVDHHPDNSRFGDVNLVVADASSTGEGLRARLARAGWCWSTSRRARLRSRSWPRSAGGPVRVPATRGRSTRSPRGSCSCCPVRQLSSPRASWAWTSATRPTS